MNTSSAEYDQFLLSYHKRLLRDHYEQMKAHADRFPEPVDLAQFEPQEDAPYTGSARFDYWAAVIYTQCECVVTYHDDSDSKVRFTGKGWGLGAGGGIYGTGNMQIYKSPSAILGECKFSFGAVPLGAYARFHRNGNTIADAVFGGIAPVSGFGGSGEWKVKS